MSDEISLWAYLAAHVDVSVYNPWDTWVANQGEFQSKTPTVRELADIIAMIRICEADAIIARMKEEQID